MDTQNTAERDASSISELLTQGEHLAEMNLAFMAGDPRLTAGLRTRARFAAYRYAGNPKQGLAYMRRAAA